MMELEATSRSYRPEIDGLRALAVVSIVLYHAQLGVSGGFVGVDVFFVISGYLITRLLLKESEGGKLDLWAFWERRVRRLFPALAVVMLATVIAGWLLFLPVDYEELGQSIVAQSVLGSNVFFWIRTGYFDSTAEVKPLLHTWSLAVEEQFYLFFPFVVLGLTRLSRLSASIAVVLLFALALSLSIYGANFHSRAAFYLLPFRSWELGLGAIVAACSDRFRCPNRLRELASMLGLGAVVIAMSLYQKTTPFPGVAALLPCVGGALFIYANDGGLTASGRLLAWRPWVFIGLVSYSLYLWHWPLWVFANYWALDTFPIWQRIGLVVVSFLLAVLSWKYVETPFRRKRWFRGKKQMLQFGAISSAGLLVGGLILSRLDGVRFRMHESVLRYADGRSDSRIHEVSISDAENGKFVALGSKRSEDPVDFLVWGDSHAIAVSPALDSLGSVNFVRGFAATRSMTPPLLGKISKYGVPEDSPAFNEAVMAFIRANRIRNVILVAKWDIYQDDRDAFRAALTKTVRYLGDSGVRIWVMQDVPHFPWDVPKALARAALFEEDPNKLLLPLSVYYQQVENQGLDFLRTVDTSIAILQPTEYLRRGDVMLCSTDGAANYHDANHLSVKGAMLLVPMFAPIFAR